MPFLIGTDEAGYGPNLGPLVIGGTRWSTPKLETDLDAKLSAAVVRERERRLRKSAAENAPLPKLFMSDSKEVYKSGNIRPLELGVLASFAAIHDRVPKDSHDLVRSVCNSDSTDFLSSEFWLSGRPVKLPLACDPKSIMDQAQRLQAIFAKSKTELNRLDATLVFPNRFNAGIEELGNKATLLSAKTLQMIREMVEEFDSQEPIRIRCDKHGGRNSYASLLQQYVTESPVRTEMESKLRSHYTWNRTSIEFVPKGESFLPVALASMLAKYLRELMMVAWNSFWQIKLPDLRPTKGYPQDAKRFKKEIETVQRKLQISDNQIWRNR